MKLWILRPAGNLPETDNPWEPWYDKNFGFVIRAETEARAREIADRNAGDENRDANHPWLNARYSTCVELLPDGQDDVLIIDSAGG